MTNVGNQGPKSFHKSSYSQGASNCVEVAEGSVTAVRDTQNRHLGHLDVPATEWAALLGVVRGWAGTASAPMAVPAASRTPKPLSAASGWRRRETPGPSPVSPEVRTRTPLTSRPPHARPSFPAGVRDPRRPGLRGMGATPETVSSGTGSPGWDTWRPPHTSVRGPVRA